MNRWLGGILARQPVRRLAVFAARIEGVQGGRPRGVDFPMRRAKCPEGAVR